MEFTASKKENGLTVEVTITRKTQANIGYADGWNINLGKKTYENTTIKVKKGGMKVFCNDINFFYILESGSPVLAKMPLAYARIGDTYIGRDAYNTINTTLADAKKAADAETSENFNKVKAAENKKEDEQKAADAQFEKTANERAKHPGWCDKCHSYCYGDCTAT